MTISAGRRAAFGASIKWSRRIATSVAILLVLGLLAALLNNSVSIQRPSHTEFVANLDQALARSTDWALS